VYPRVNGDGGELMNHKKLKLVNAPLVEISSTAIRAAIKEKKDMRYFMNSEVWEYLKSMHFYENK
jgi:nicotinate-nucleotide adenylyltransferase